MKRDSFGDGAMMPAGRGCWGRDAAHQKPASFPTSEAVRKSFWLAHRSIAQSWDRPLHNWELILNQLAIRFESRFPL